MKILILNQHYYPEVAATAQLVADLAEDLAYKAEVSVVTGMPSYLQQKFSSLPRYERHENVEIYRVFTTAFARQSIPGRIANYLSFYLFAFVKILSLPRFDTVIVMSTPPYLALLGVFLKKLKRIRFVYWLHDIYPEIAIAFGFIRKGRLFARSLAWLSHWIYRQADTTVVLAEEMRRELQRTGIADEKISIVHNWCDPRDFADDGGDNPIRQQLGLNDKFVVLYSGNMGIAHEFATVQKAILALREIADIAFLFIGDGAKKPELQKFADDNGLTNVHFCPYQPRNMLRYSFRCGDVFLVTLDPRAAHLLVPSKIYGALAAAKPILAVVPKETEVWEITERGCGTAVMPGDCKQLQQAILRFYRDRDFHRKCAENCATIFAREFSREVATQKFARLLLPELMEINQ